MSVPLVVFAPSLTKLSVTPPVDANLKQGIRMLVGMHDDHQLLCTHRASATSETHYIANARC